MILDVKTLYVILVLSSGLMALAMTAAYAGKFRDGVGKWTLALFLFGISNILILGRGAIPDFLSIILANILVAIGSSLGYAAVCEFMERPTNPWFLYSPPVMIIISFGLLMGNLPARVLVIGLINGGLDSVALYLILRDPTIRDYRMRWLLFAGFLCAVVMFLGRIIFAALIPQSFQTVFAGNMIQSVTLTCGFFAVILISFGFILLSRERVNVQNQQGAEALLQSEERFRQLSEATVEGIVIHDGVKILNANQALARMFGYDLPEIIGKNPLELAAPEDRNLIMKNILNDYQEPYEVIGLRKDTSTFWSEQVGKPIPYQGGLVRVAAIRDITERKRLLKKHEQLNRLREELIGSKSLDQKLKIITEGVVTILSAEFARIWIIKPGDRCWECTHSGVREGPHVCQDRDRCLHLIASSGRYTHLDGEVHSRVPYGCYKIGQVASGLIPSFVTNQVRTDSRVHNPDWVEELGLVSFAGYRLLSVDGEPVGVLALFSRQIISSDDGALLEGLANSTAQVIQTARIETSLRESEERYRTAIEQSNDGIVLVKGDMHIFVNKKMVEIFGYDHPEEILGQPVSLLIHPDDLERVVDFNLRRQKGEAVPQQYEFKGRRKNGEPVYIEVSAVKTTYQGETASLVFLRDITDRKQAEEALNALSLRDELTGLYNRRGFFTLAEQALKSAQRMGTEMFLLFGDLDNLKGINDTLGHKEGDQALIDTALLLKETFRESDIIARIGGDEFVILAMNSLETSAKKVITRFEKILNEHHLKTMGTYRLSLSLGIARFDPKNPCSIDVLLAQADKMMYKNKQKRKTKG
jgi:diguanylate cyclase (GGDEF)-like protein/PAS domain S-box-containing protein